MKKTGVILYLLALALLPPLFVWTPFFFQVNSVFNIPLPSGGMQVIASNYDGPLYIVIAKSFYDLPYIAANYSFPLPLEYYAAHLPFYPLMIKLFSLVPGHLWGMLLATLAGSVICVGYFYLFISKYVSKKHALWLVAVFAIFPARWLIVRSVGSPEPFFVGAILASVYHFDKRQYWMAGIWGAMAQLTKSPAILLFIAYGCTLFVPKIRDLFLKQDFSKWLKTIEYKAYPLLLIPLSLVGLFYIYSIRFNDFFAYFNSGNNIHLYFPPFQIFDYSQPWVNTHWLEEIIFIYLLGLLGVSQLIKRKFTTLAWFTGIFFTSILFVSHRDVLRYSLPILPFLFVAYASVMTTREFKIIMAILIIPIYLFTLVFIANNSMPISDWGSLL